MSNLIKLHAIDCIFLSYDEPNAERNWADLLNKAPWAKRVHGIKGSDAAHKACADASDTEHFITVDGDNIVDPAFFDLEIPLDEFESGINSQLSWSGRNHINGLMYGNGGLKCWTREHVWNMRTHEAADDDTNQVDFCWNPNYHHMSGCYSVVYNNMTPLQAFRAGFREGVKMTLMDGVKLESEKLRNMRRYLPAQNYHRLLIWCSVGADVKNGNWAVYGARLGAYMTNCTDWDYVQVRDFDYLNQLFKDQNINTDEELYSRSSDLRRTLKTELNMTVADFDASQSEFFKATYNNLPRSRTASFDNAHVTEIQPHEIFDIVFISNGEDNAEENYKRLLERAPADCTVHRVDGVAGIANAHQAAAKLATTEMFYVVDADAWILDNFRFEVKREALDYTITYVYNSFNPVNNLVYGYGGVKLFPKSAFDQLPEIYVDMTTSILDTLRVLPEISNITKFDTGAYDTWRSAFRECVKLSSRVIKSQNDADTEYRLNTWCNNAQGPYGAFAIKGARAGKDFGTIHADDPAQLAKINDYNFLKAEFSRHHG